MYYRKKRVAVLSCRRFFSEYAGGVGRDKSGFLSVWNIKYVKKWSKKIKILFVVPAIV